MCTTPQNRGEVVCSVKSALATVKFLHRTTFERLACGCSLISGRSEDTGSKFLVTDISIKGIYMSHHRLVKRKKNGTFPLFDTSAQMPHACMTFTCSGRWGRWACRLGGSGVGTGTSSGGSGQPRQGAAGRGRTCVGVGVGVWKGGGERRQGNEGSAASKPKGSRMARKRGDRYTSIYS